MTADRVREVRAFAEVLVAECDLYTLAAYHNQSAWLPRTEERIVGLAEHLKAALERLIEE